VKVEWLGMTALDKDLFAIILQLPYDKKALIVDCIESLCGMSLAEYKEIRIREVRALLDDVRQNPDNYNTVNLKNTLNDLIGQLEISKELSVQIGLVKRFIGYRDTTVLHTDGQVENRDHITFEEFIKDKKY